MLYPTLTLESLIEQLQTEISLLQQLHILSQTEYLVLEKEDYSELREVVEIKEALVQQIGHQEDQLTRMLRASQPILLAISAEQRQMVEALKQETLALLEHISRVEAKNRLHVERFKADTTSTSCAPDQDRTLLRIYDSPPEIANLISHLAD
jgi:flagellar FlgN protein